MSRQTRRGSDPRVEYITSHPDLPYDRIPSQPFRRVYRGTSPGRAFRYINNGDESAITTRRPGDFHRNYQQHPTAYFTFNERYADRVAPTGGYVIEQRVPTDIIRDSRAHNFDDEPTPEWRRVVRHNRNQQPLPGEERRIQRAPVVTGPIADVSTPGLIHHTRRYREESDDYNRSFHPALTDSSSNDSDVDEDRRRHRHVQQIAFSGDALRRLTLEPRYARPVRPQPRRQPGNSPRIITIAPPGEHR